MCASQPGVHTSLYVWYWRANAVVYAGSVVLSKDASSVAWAPMVFPLRTAEMMAVAWYWNVVKLPAPFSPVVPHTTAWSISFHEASAQVAVFEHPDVYRTAKNMEAPYGGEMMDASSSKTPYMKHPEVSRCGPIQYACWIAPLATDVTAHAERFATQGACEKFIRRPVEPGVG